jgi:hypothetical protein
MDADVDGNVLKSLAPELLSNYPVIAINDVQEVALDVVRHDNRLAAWRRAEIGWRVSCGWFPVQESADPFVRSG